MLLNCLALVVNMVPKQIVYSPVFLGFRRCSLYLSYFELDVSVSLRNNREYYELCSYNCYECVAIGLLLLSIDLDLITFVSINIVYLIV